MNAEDVVAYFSKLDPKEPVIIGWWEHEAYEDISKEDWNKLCVTANLEIDWDDVDDQITDLTLTKTDSTII